MVKVQASYQTRTEEASSLTIGLRWDSWVSSHQGEVITALSSLIESCMSSVVLTSVKDHWILCMNLICPASMSCNWMKATKVQTKSWLASISGAKCKPLETRCTSQAMLPTTVPSFTRTTCTSLGAIILVHSSKWKKENLAQMSFATRCSTWI